MREIVSPLDGIRSPFGRRSSVSPLAIYAVLGFKPELVLDFDDEKYFADSTATTFSDALTHSASSNATMVDSDGLLKWRPHNLLTYSEQFDNASWVKQQATVSANAAAAPDGTTTADRITSTGGPFIRITGQTFSLPAVNHTISIWVKAAAAGNRKFRLVANQAPGSAVGTASTVFEATDDWQMFSFTATGGSGYWGVSQAISPDFDHDLLIWGAHLYRSDLGGMVDNPDRGDSYVPTTSTARFLPRRGHHIYNGTSWVNEGLLHESEARTNLVTYSEEFDNASWVKAPGVTVTANTDVAPDGTTSADTVTSGGNQITQGVSCVQNTVYTDSLFFKKTTEAAYTPALYLIFTGGTTTIYAAVINTNTGVHTVATAAGFTAPLAVSVSDAGAYWRLSVSGNSGNNTTADLRMYPNLNPVSSGVGPGSQVIWGAQLEAGSTPSSYIPNAGATSGATRAAETATEPDTVTPYNATAMSGASSLLLSYADTGSATEQTVFDWRADANNRITVTLDTAGANTGRVTLTVVNGGSSVSVSSTNQVTPGLSVAARVAWRVTTSEINIALNGTAATAVSNTAGVPDLSAASATLGGMAVRKLERGWAADITDAGLEAATV